MSGKNETGSDPSMDDILASIRRILDEEETKPVESRVDSLHGVPPIPARPAPPETEPEDVLELEPSMMVPDPDEAAPGPVPGPPPVLLEPPAAPVPAPERAPLSDAIPLAVPFPPLPQSQLVAPEAAAAAAMSVGTLMRTLASEKSAATHRGGPTIEDLVREEIRPLLKDWLDNHLPPMVERLVRAEIERVLSRN